MVMKRNAMRKNLRQSILKSFGRYIAIVAIIALGASMFVGLLMTKSDMVATGQKFMDEQNMFDLRLLNSYGWGQEHLDAISQMDCFEAVEGIKYQDIIVRLNDSSDDLVYRFYAMPEKINLVSLRGGRMPQAPDECLADGYHKDDSILGTTVTISPTNDQEDADAFAYKTYTVVGYIASPLYMDMNRGTTTVGSGSLSDYVLIPGESLNLDYYTEINVTLPGSHKVYSDDYNTLLESEAERLEPLIQPYATDRLGGIRKEAEDAYREGKQAYDDGVKEFREGKEEGIKELEDALKTLEEAEITIAENEQKLIQGQQMIHAGWAQLAEGQKEFEEGKAQFEQLKGVIAGPIISAESAFRTRYNAVAAQVSSLESQIQGLDDEIAQIRASIAENTQRISELKSQISGINSEISQLDARIAGAWMLRETLNIFPTINADRIAQLDASLAEMNGQKASLQEQLAPLQQELETLTSLTSEPEARIQELEAQKPPIQSELNRQRMTLDAMEPTLNRLTSSREGIESLLSGTEAELAAAEKQLAEGRAQLNYQQGVLEEGKKALEQGKKDLEQGWIDYEEGKKTFEEEIAKAELELEDARLELENAWDLISRMTKNDVIILDRNSNIGYNSLDSASDIVQGVSRVFPAFFLLVAAMVCITTMTRMVDEERTQIGTLKALGYSNGEIIRKYLIYAGSGAVLGCGLGVLVGSAAFPVILWQAYKIMLYITDDIVLRVNWWLCGAVVGAYTLVMLLVTWNCCRKALKEEPAELIRPKSPDAGKKILLEYLPFWPRISFLNKVTIRNIFRYRQRMFMMLLGIGGCTALLLTGFGLRDSIVNVVDYQFKEVTVYDMSVYFVDGQTDEEQESFIRRLSDDTEKIMFYHQTSVDMEFENRTREIYLVAAESGVTDFINLHDGEEILSPPGKNEAMLSVGAAEGMGVSVGDEILLRNAQLETLTLTVSGIYDNHVENYVIIAPETITEQWGEAPAMQMAFVKAEEGVDIYELSAKIGGMGDVMNVSVSEDLAEMVGSMMEALDLVVWVIVICAGALAAIVLYNLTNINITERIREIATIKVLGFNAKETAMYVFKENLALSVVGSVFGLGLGYLLLLFVMSQIRIDMVWFKALATPMSYALSVGLTMLAAFVVDFIFYFKLDKINMAEALKSVE